jgi:hypothetical protein
MQSGHKITLEEQQFKDFDDQGFLIFENFLNEENIQELKDSVDAKNADAAGDPSNKKYVIEYGSLGELTAHEDTMHVLDQLFGDQNYTMHHIHAVRQDAGNKGIGWHHDYEQFPQTNRNYLMVHVFYYLNGLNGEIGDLLVMPGSHKMINDGNFGLFGTDDLPGSLALDNLAPGSMIVVHSGLLHGRRKKPGGENSPRYFIDASYCEKGIRWPRYHSAVEINEIALQNNLDQDGRYAYLYDTEQFYPRGTIREMLNQVDESIRHLFAKKE